MSLTVETLSRISDLTLASHEALSKVIGSEAAIALPSSMSVVDLEKFMPNRRRFRGNLATENIDAFCDYALYQLAGDVFVSSQNMSARAIFDLGNEDEPGHCEHTASLGLTKTAAYDALLSVDGVALGQKALAEWLEDWGRYIQCFDTEGEDLHISKALASVRKMTIETARKIESEEQNMGRQLSAMERIEVKSEGQQLGGFYFVCTPYNGFSAKQFRIPLSALTGGETIKLKLRIQEVEAIKEEITEEFYSKIESKLSSTSGAFNIWMGTFNS
jgi:uncharacterized protein YfdQ (DUF2303 family)